MLHWELYGQGDKWSSMFISMHQYFVIIALLITTVFYVVYLVTVLYLVCELSIERSLLGVRVGTSCCDQKTGDPSFSFTWREGYNTRGWGLGSICSHQVQTFGNRFGGFHWSLQWTTGNHGTPSYRFDICFMRSSPLPTINVSCDLSQFGRCLLLIEHSGKRLLTKHFFELVVMEEESWLTPNLILLALYKLILNFFFLFDK